MFRASRNLSLMLSIAVLAVLFLSTQAAVAQDDNANKAKENFNAGIKAEQEGKIEAAILAYQAAITVDPNFVDAHLNLGAIYFQQKEYQKAEEQFTKAVDAAPENADALANLGRLQYLTKRYDPAIANFEKALAGNPNDADLLKDLAKCQYRKRNYEKAEELLSSCHKAGGGDNSTYYMLGNSQYKLDKTDAAIASLKQSIDLDGTYYSALSLLGRIYLAQQKWGPAATYYKRAMNTKSSQAYRAAYNYAIAVEQQDPENYSTNLKNWESFVRMAKGNPKASKDIASAQSHIDELKEAIAQIELQ